jgi:hypothetical protein
MSPPSIQSEVSEDFRELERMQEMVLGLLEARQIELTEPVRARITACTNSWVLARWIITSLVAEDAEYIFRVTPYPRPAEHDIAQPPEKPPAPGKDREYGTNG